MGIGDKISNKAEELGGKIERGVGDLTDNEELEAKGAAKEAAAKAKQAGEHVKDAAKDVVDDVKDATHDKRH
ncbi:CsbD family protein [Propioniciclava coleopterorum]|uniref:CsbD family protein n=1 Tax=Propioniciclava coleopterorum TaxID=2714937 RepID=A0A6G7Y438_9ACTN|nr:CsbD family protein [Propioniciclava coleopterorum]QIK71408.1 CsbD family protein [Propioniciclava coleopterorum]